MSKTVDERVLEMRFDNKQFESNVKQSMSTLDRLKAALKFDKGVNGLDKIGKAAKNVNMSGLASSVDQVKRSFSMLDVVGVTALANITNSAVNAGKKMVKALTLEPIMTGFQEYETKINAVQTIMANTAKDGMTMQDVTTVLDDLNYYADKTIYNFTEMTRNIGTFTAAGVGLYDAAGAIKGIANLAAVSGSTSQQASTAMYQLSQALATGRVALQDWNSVVNAGMGGTKFQEALKQTARDMGIAVDDIIESYGSFRDSLTRGEWLTSDVLSQTLKNFTVEGAQEYAEQMVMLGKYTQEQADALMREAQIAEDAATKVKTFTQLWDVMKEAAQSGWAQTWETIIGDFEEAKEFLTPIGDLMSTVIAESANARNSVLESGLRSNWKTLSDDIRAAGIDMNEFQEKLISVGKEHGVITDQMIIDAGGFEQSLKSGWASGDIFAEALRSYKMTAEDFGISTDQMQDKLSAFQETIHDVWSQDFTTHQERLRALAEAGYDYNDAQELITKTLEGQTLSLEDLSVAEMKALGFTQDEIMALQDMATEAETTGTAFNKLIEDLTKPSGRELFLEGFSNILMGFIDILDIVREAWANVFPPIEGSTLYGWMEGFRDLTEKFRLTKEQANLLRDDLTGLFSILHMIWTAVTVPLKVAFEALAEVLAAVRTPLYALIWPAAKVVTAFDKLIFSSGAYEKAVRALPNTIKKVASVFAMWFEEFKQLPQVQEFVANVQEKFNSALDAIQAKLDEVGGAMGEFIQRIKAMDMIHLSDLPNIFKDFYENVLSTAIDFDAVFATIQGGLENFFDLIRGIASNIVSVFQGFAGKIASVTGKIKNVLKDNFNFGDIFAVLISATTLTGLAKFGKVLDLIAGPVEGISKIFKKFSDVLGSVEKYINAKAWAVKANSIKTIATALLELAAALYILAQIPSEKLIEGVGAIGILGAGLIGFAAAMNKVGGPAGMEKAGLSLIAFGAAIALMASALDTISEINPKTLLGSVIALEVIIGSLAGVSVLLATKAPQLSKGSRFLLSFGVAVKVLVSALEQLNKIDAKDLPKTMTLLLGAIGTMAALAKLAAGVNWGGGAGLVMMVGSVKLLVMLIDDLASIEPGPAMKAVVGLLPVLLMFKLILKTVQGADFGAGALAAGGSLLMMSAAIAILAVVIRAVADLDVKSAAVGIVAINSFLISFSVVLIFLNGIKGQMIRAAVSLTIMSAAIGILAGVITLLSLLDPAGMARGLAAVVMLQLVFAQMMIASHSVKGNYKSLTVLVVSIGILAAAATALSMLDPAGIARGTIAMSALMGMFAVLLRATSVAKKATATIFIMLGVIALLTGMLVALAQLPIQASIASATALSVLLVVMTGCLYALSALKASAVKGVGALALLLTVVGGIASILAIMEEYDVNPSIETAESIAILLGTMTGVLAALSLLGKGAVSAIPAAGALDAIIVIIGALMVGLGALSKWIPKLKEFATEGIEVLNLIASGIGQFVGNIVGGVLEGVSDHLGSIADNLSDFMKRLNPFLKGANKIKPEMAQGIESLSAMILNLTKADFMSSISNFVTGGSTLTEFAEQLIPFGEALSEFANVTKNVDASQMHAVANAAQALADMADSLPESGGLKQKLTGVKDMQAFIEDLDPLAEALIEFSEKTTGGAINVSGMNQIAEAAQHLVDLANSLPSQGGLLEKLAGVKDLSVFAEQIKDLATALVDFSNTTGDINVTKMGDVATGAKALVEMANEIPSMDGLWQLLAGEKNFSTFGDQLADFGDSIAKFSNAITKDGGINTDAIDSSANAAKALVELANNLPDPGFFNTQYSFSAFGSQLEQFGESFSAFATSIVGIEDTDCVDNTIAMAEAMSGLANKLPDPGFFATQMNLTQFGNQLESFGSSFATFAGSVKEVNADSLDGIIVAAGDMTDMAIAIGSVDMNAFTEMVGSMRLLVNARLDEVGESLTTFSTELVNFCTSVGNIPEANMTSATSIMKSLIELQEMLPEDKLFVNEEWLDDFGYRLRSFGNNLAYFQTATKDIKLATLNPVIIAAGRLAEMAVDLGGTDMTGFKDFVSSLDDFGRVGKAFKDFQSQMEDVDNTQLQTSVDSLKIVSGIAGHLSDLDLTTFEQTLTSLKKLAKADLSNLSDNLDTFAEAIVGFSDKVKGSGEGGGIDVTAIDNATHAGEALAGVANALPEASVFSKFKGQKQALSDFAEMLPDVGDNIAKFSSAVSGNVDAGSVTAAAMAGRAMAGLAENLPESKFSLFTTKMSLSSFASQLPDLGEKLADFGQKIKDNIDTESVDAAIHAGEAIAGLINALPTEGAFDYWTGDKTMALGDFAKELPTFGGSIALFASALGAESINQDVVNSAISAAEAVAGLVNNLPTDPTVLETWLGGGTMDLSVFAEKLPLLGDGLTAFATSISGITDMDAVGRATGIAQSLGDLLTTVAQVQGEGGIQSIGMFGTQLELLGEDLANFATSLTGINLGGLQMVVDGIQPFVGLASELKGADVSGALRGFAQGLSEVADISISNICAKLNGGAEAVRTAVDNLMKAFNSGLADNSLIPTKTITDAVNGMVTAINNASGSFSTAAAGCMSGFNTAIETGIKGTKQTFINTLQECINAIRQTRSSFSSAGGYVIMGLAEGMESKRGQLKAKAQAIARELSDTINNALEVNSPSRVTMRTGNFVMLGLAKGLTDNVKVVKEAGGKAASAVITSMQDELQINSPSIKARDEVGKYIIDGIAEGIEANMKAEEAAEQKAQNIIEAFQNELAKFQWTWDTADLQFQLFEALNEDVYSEQDMKKMKLEHEKDKLKYLAETAENARGQYQYMVDTFGKGSDNAKDAYQEWLQAQVDVAKQAKSIKDTIKDINESITEYNEKGAEVMSGDRWKAYQEALEKMKPAMDQFGYTFEQIDEIARKQTGYGNFVKQELLDTTKTIKDYVNEAMSGVTGLYSDFVKTNFGKGLEEYAKTGAMIGDAITTGVSNSQPKMEEASTNLTDIGEAAILNKTSSYENAGKTLGEALADGINAAQPAVDKAVNNLVNSANQATKAVETVKKSNSQNSPGVNSGKTNLNTFTNVSGQTVVGTPLKGGWIKIDTESTDRLASQISNETSRKLANDVASQIQQSGSSKSLSGGETAKITNNYTFTQNNTSPKALNASTLYRHSNNLFSLLKTRA